MNESLAQFYGTKQASAVTDEEAEKVASVELFLKVASDQQIDLNSMSDADVQTLYGEFQAEVAKLASEEPAHEPPKDEKKEEEKKKEEEEKKHAAAAAEFAEKTAMAADIAKADYLGRVMAHSFEQERGYIKEAGAAEAFKKLTGKGPHMAAHDAGEAVRHGAHAVGEAAGRVADKAGKGLEHLGKKITEKATGVGTHNMKPSHAKAVGGAAVAGGAAAAGAGAAAAHHHKKHASALDELGAERAVEMVAADGTFDVEEAGRKVAAVLELGLLGESEKVASAPNYQVGVDIRALEILEAAGYPVTWNDPAAT
jgi:hypothetical protein